ncbi:MAG: hypothetical protein CSA62_01360 [Planctomycetota bacterium]|nr:MAG: hypothetical protein CSA62_01360 [Planctomycetota bacterium]
MAGSGQYSQGKVSSKASRHAKHEMRSTPWSLDQPKRYLGWAALRLFPDLFHQGITGQKDTNDVFRGDISRPQGQGSLLDTAMAVM